MGLKRSGFPFIGREHFTGRQAVCPCETDAQHWYGVLRAMGIPKCCLGRRDRRRQRSWATFNNPATPAKSLQQPINAFAKPNHPRYRRRRLVHKPRCPMLGSVHTHTVPLVTGSQGCASLIPNPGVPSRFARVCPVGRQWGHRPQRNPVDHQTFKPRGLAVLPPCSLLFSNLGWSHVSDEP